MFYIALLAGILFLSAHAQGPEASISSAESSKCLEAGILDIIDGDPVRMLVWTKIYNVTNNWFNH